MLPKRDRVNEGAVTIISAPVGGITSILMSDLARVVDNAEGHREGTGSERIDILDVKSIDMGAVVSDVPEFQPAPHRVHI